MNTKEIVSELDAEISRLTQVRELLDGAAKSAKRRGRPVGSINRAAKDAVSLHATGATSSKRTMSPEGKARIAAAQRERWARQNASTHSPAKKSPVPKKLSSKRDPGKSLKKGSKTAAKRAVQSAAAGDVSSKKRLGRPPKTGGTPVTAKVNSVNTPPAVA